MFRRTCSHDLATTVATLGPEIDDPVGALNHLQVVFDNNHRVTGIAQLHQYLQQFLDIGKVQSGRRLIENVYSAPGRFLCELRREFHALRFSSGKGRASLAKTQITEAHIQQGIELF